MLILSNRRASLQVDPIISTFARSSLSFFFSMVFVSSVPSCLCFSRPPTLFFKDSHFLIKYPFYWCEVSSFFSFNVLIRWFSHEDTNGASSLLFFVLFLLRWTKFKPSMLVTFLSLFQMFSHAGVSLNHSPFAFHVFRSVEDISGDSHFHSQSVQAISRLLSLLSHLVQPVLSPFQVIIQRCIFWVGPNPQVFSQDLTWLF